MDVNGRDKENITPLHWAAINNRIAIVEFVCICVALLWSHFLLTIPFSCCHSFLLKRDAIVDAVGGELQATPAHWAIRYVLVIHFDHRHCF